jgi:predicted polyphosphate/ATP-dependent NAD kinase
MAEMTTYIVEVIENMELLKPPCQSIVPSQILARIIADKHFRSIFYFFGMENNGGHVTIRIGIETTSLVAFLFLEDGG